MRHDQVVAVRRHRSHLERGLCRLDRPHIRRHIAKKITPAVDPANVAVETRQGDYDGRAHVPGTKHGDIEIGPDNGFVELLHLALRARSVVENCSRSGNQLRVCRRFIDTEYTVGRDHELRGRRLRNARHDDCRFALAVQRAQVPQPGGHAAGNRFEQNLHDPAATLAHRRTQRETAQRELFLGKHADSNARALILQLPATDRADRLAGRDDHLRADFSRRRTANACHRDKHGRLSRRTQVTQFVDPLIHRRHLAAHAESPRALPVPAGPATGFASAIASRNARKADKPSISGGSPTALER